MIWSAGQIFVEMASSSSAECGAAAAAVNGDSAESPPAATAMSADENDELAFEVWPLKNKPESEILSLPRTATEYDFKIHENSLDKKKATAEWTYLLKNLRLKKMKPVGGFWLPVETSVRESISWQRNQQVILKHKMFR